MKNVLFNSIVLFSLCLMAQSSTAQQVEVLDNQKEVVEKTDKAKLLKKYTWLSTHLKKMTKVKAIAEMRHKEHKDFVIIETTDSKIMYDSNGKTYCTESPELNCTEYYKLTPGKLKWRQS